MDDVVNRQPPETETVPGTDDAEEEEDGISVERK